MEFNNHKKNCNMVIKSKKKGNKGHPCIYLYEYFFFLQKEKNRRKNI